MTIRVNGQPQELPDRLTVAELLQELKLDPKFLAVERNRELVPRTQHQSCILSDGDDVEIVTLVGGG